MKIVRPIWLVLSLCSALLISGCESVPKTPSQPSSTETNQPTAAQPIKVALVLGGGAARGFAHIGVIKALEAQGIEPDIVVGTSAGSLVGALYASGYNGFELQRLALAINEAEISDWSIPSRGVLKGEALQNYVNRMVENKPIEKLKRRFAAVSTDLQQGQLTLFQYGNTGMAVRASSSVPGVFQPVRINGKEYVDGGLISPIPVRSAKRLGADFVIAVDISANPEGQAADGTMAILLQTFAIMGKQIGTQELTEADVVIRPALKGVKGTDFQARNTNILEGERAAQAMIPQIKEKLKKLQQQHKH